MELPKVLIWKPEEENEVGHVALKTDKYYVSIWPARYLKVKRLFRWVDAVTFMGGVKGSLVLNINVDREREGDRDSSVEYDISEAVTNEDLNPIIEEFLLYNEINLENVTLERGEELFLKRQEYEKLSPKQAEKVKEPEQPETSLLKTKYSISAELLSGKKKEAEPFYHKQQSCVSLIFNLIQLAWLKHHPDRPIPIEVPDIIEVFIPSHNYTERFYRVTWFDSVVQQNFMSISNNTGQTTEEPAVLLLIHFVKNFNWRLLYATLPILAIFSYFFQPPFWCFVMYVFIIYPDPYFHLVNVILFIMLSYIFPAVPIISIIVLVAVCFILMGIVRMQRLGQSDLLEIVSCLSRNLLKELYYF